MKHLKAIPAAITVIVLPSALAGSAAPPAPNAKAASEVVFPADSGVVNVQAQFGAKGDGVTDDTAAIQKALDQYPSGNKIIYLPSGTYLISDTLRWPAGSSGGQRMKRTILQGQSEAQTVVKLRDRCPGYGDPAKPRPMIYTGEKPAQRFRNSIRGLTVDTGNGNGGAIGVQYIANNQGSVHHLTVRSGDGRGVIGLDLGYTNEQGPCLIKSVTVEGFDVGISTKHAVDSVTLEHITLRRQNRYGFVNDGQCLSIRGLNSSNTVPAFHNVKGASLVALVDANLEGTGAAANAPAILNEAGLFARNVKTAGYKQAIQNSAGTGKSPAGTSVDEWVSHPLHTRFEGTPPRSLNLPVKETPELPWDELAQWAGPQQFGGKGDGKTDNTEALQKAIDGGKTTLYLPSGNWKFDGDVFVRGNIRRIIGCEAKLSGKGLLKVIDGAAPVIRIERLDLIYSDVNIEHASKRTLVVSSVTLGNGDFLTRPESGDLFLEDVCGTGWRFKNQNVWARQLNPEGNETKIVNDGGTLWILGLKSEGDGTLVESKGGAKTEVVGGFAYANSGRPKKPMFISNESSLSLTIGEFVIRSAPFLELVIETRNGVTKTLRHGETPGRGGGSLIPLYVGYPADAARRSQQ
jgi:hypothetical protein